MEKLLKPGDLAERYGVLTQQVYRWAKAGQIPHRRIGKSILFDRNEIAEWEAARSYSEEAG